jgi:hypothetical protein
MIINDPAGSEGMVPGSRSRVGRSQQQNTPEPAGMSAEVSFSPDPLVMALLSDVRGTGDSVTPVFPLAPPGVSLREAEPVEVSSGVFPGCAD